jgi:pantoate--beta-alanine ligase
MAGGNQACHFSRPSLDPTTEMLVLDSIAQAREAVANLRRRGPVGFVPTMGALHAGHVSLVRASRARCSATAVSIFVNPLQFGPHEDLQRYPRMLDQDLQLLRSEGVDLVFVPDAEAMEGAHGGTRVEPGDVAKRWEGEFRPGHFRGVATVVLRLFQIIPATDAFFGQKDFQQLRVIQTMVSDLHLPISVHMEATVRDRDGLALSSRNRYLSKEDRQRALGLSRALQRATQQFDVGERSADVLRATLHATLDEYAVDSIDYADVVDRQSLEPLAHVDGPAVMLIAARVGNTRLLDNGLLGASPEG